MQPTPVTSRNDSPFARLDLEWASLCTHRRRYRAALRRWIAQEPVLATVETLDEIISDDMASRRTYFEALVRLVRTNGDQLAARALLQLLVPGLIHVSNALGLEQRGSLGSRRDVDTDVIFFAWAQITALANGTSTARTAKVILRNVRRDTLSMHTSAARKGVVPIDPTLIGDGGERTDDYAPTDARLTLAEAVQNQVITARGAELIWQVEVHGRRITEVADDLGFSRATAFSSRRTAVDRLRGHLAEAS